MTTVPATLRIRSEGALRSRAARGDAVAFAAVYERHHQALYRYCRSILRHDEDAQDALQSTMTRAFAALQDEQRDFELRPWLFRIAHNEAITILRRRRETRELDEQPALGDLEDRVAEREELRLLQLDLADLPERQRAALVLRELNGLSHAEIAVVLELSTGAVKQAIFDARSALFSFREGREMACHDIRRMLSDGDGRVLRGRGVRGHLRACPDCRRFRADLEQRPKSLRALAPPLPAGGAAALLAQILGGGGGATAAKLLACIAIAGGGTTLAVEMQQARKPTPAAAATATPAPTRAATAKRPVPAAKPPVTPVRPAVVAAAPQSEPEAKAKARPKKPKAAKRAKRAKRAVATPPAVAQATAPGQVKAPKTKAIGKAVGRIKVKVKAPKTAAPGKVKKATKVQKKVKPAAPGQAKQHAPKPSGPPAGHGKAKQQAPKPTGPPAGHGKAKQQVPKPTGPPADHGEAEQQAPKPTGPPADHGDPENSGKAKADK